jgi:hypothetical protein
MGARLATEVGNAANTNACSVGATRRIVGMNYSYYDLGQRKRGETIEVSLSAAANVFLVDNANYSSLSPGGTSATSQGRKDLSCEELILCMLDFSTI